MAEQNVGRTPPQSVDAEKAVIGCILLNEKAAYICVEKLQPIDFYRPNHALIFECINELILENKPVDLVSVTDKLNTKNKYNNTEDIRYLSDMTMIVPTVENLTSYIEIIKEKSILRQLANSSNDIIRQVYDSEQSVDSILSKAGDMIYDIATSENANDLEHIRKPLMESYLIMANQAENRGQLLGVAGGFPKFDAMLSGFQKNQLIVIAGRPGMGKTSFGLNIIQNVALAENQPVAVFSLEMSKEQLTTRMMCAEARVDSQKARTGHLTVNDFEKLANASEKLSKANIYIDDSPGINMTEILAKLRRMKMEHGLSLVMIDYLQLMHSAKKTENRQQEVSNITRSVKLLAKEIDVPVLLLSQLSRASEKRGKDEHLPVLSDLRESGSIEQDADVVIFIHRDNYYEEEASESTATIKIAKQRSGPTGNIDMLWNGEYTRFEEDTGAAPIDY